MVQEIHSYNEFQELINGGEPVIVDFYADWCGPCKAISPEFARLSEQYATVKFRKVNIDEQEQISAEVGIRAIPAFIVFQNGNKIDEVVGANLAKLKTIVTNASSLRA